MAWSSSNRRSRLPANWRKLRSFVLDRDQHRCQWIVGSRRCGAKATEVHHLIEAGRNDGVELNDPAFLIAICVEHHKIATRAYAQYQKEEAKNKIDFSGHPGLLS